MKTIMGREVLDTLDELVDPRWAAVLAIDNTPPLTCVFPT